MSLAIIAEHEAAVARRRARIRTLLRWAPLGLAILLVCVGGVSLLTAGATNSSNLARQHQLVTSRAAAATAARSSLDQRYAALIASSTGIDSSRVAGDTAVMSSILNGDVAAARRAGIAGTDPLLTDFAPAVQAAHARISDTWVTVTVVAGSSYSYFIGVNDVGYVQWTTDSSGIITKDVVHRGAALRPTS